MLSCHWTTLQFSFYRLHVSLSFFIRLCLLLHLQNPPTQSGLERHAPVTFTYPGEVIAFVHRDHTCFFLFLFEMLLHTIIYSIFQVSHVYQIWWLYTLSVLLWELQKISLFSEFFILCKWLQSTTNLSANVAKIPDSWCVRCGGSANFTTLFLGSELSYKKSWLIHPMTTPIWNTKERCVSYHSAQDHDGRAMVMSNTISPSRHYRIRVIHLNASLISCLSC